MYVLFLSRGEFSIKQNTYCRRHAFKTFTLFDSLLIVTAIVKRTINTKRGRLWCFISCILRTH